MRARALALVAALGAVAGCSSRTPASVVEVTLDVALPAALGDVREVWRRRFRELAPLGYEVRAAEVTDAAGGGAHLVVSVASAAPCSEEAGAAALAAITEAVTASARFEAVAPSAEAAAAVATALRASLGARVAEGAPFDVSHLHEPGAVTVRGVAWEAVRAALPAALPAGTRALRDDAAGAVRVWIAPAEPALTGRVVATAHADAADGVLTVTFTDAGREQLTALTGAHIGGFLVLTLDGVVVAAPRVANRASGGKLILVGVPGDAREVARRIAASALPAAPRLLEGAVTGCRAAK